MRDWMERMGLAIGGETARRLRGAGCADFRVYLKFFWEDDEREGWARGAIVTSGLRFKVPEDSQSSLWEDHVVLDEIFWKALRDHPVSPAGGRNPAATRPLDELGYLCVARLALSPARQADGDLLAGCSRTIRRRFKAIKHLETKLSGGASRLPRRPIQRPGWR